jgi:hypothetical protein
MYLDADYAFQCDGARPICTCCAQKHTDCVYELGPNEKPSQAIKRKNEEMQGELDSYRQLYDFLRTRPESDAHEIVRRIREASPGTTSSQRILKLADFLRHDPYAWPQDSDPAALTLPPLRVALQSPSSTDDSNGFPNVDLSTMGVEGPLAQRRRHNYAAKSNG